MEYIKLEDVLHILDLVITDDSIKHTGKAIRKRLKELPTEDVVKVKHGKWITAIDIADYEYGTCSVCNYIEWETFSRGDVPNYCPNCGAKMDLKEGAEE